VEETGTVAIKAVIFDCFGVLTRDGWLPFREKYFSDNPEFYEKATISNHKVNAGLHSYNDFIHELATMADISEAETRTAIENNPPNEPLFAYIRDELKPDYKLGFLSNAGANWLDDIFQPWQVKLFDEVLLYYEIAATKPDAIMYETIAHRLGLMPEECVFIDDQPRFCQGARDVGMHAIVYESTGQVTADLERLLHA
jgi:HAD superfamily hydrolase (TIGR01509 family)